MSAFRRLILRAPWLAATIIAAALLVRLLIPAGFMPSFDHGRFEIAICTGAGPATMAMEMPGMAKPGAAHEAMKSPCAFADLALPAIGGADPIQLAEAIRFILALGLVIAVGIAPLPQGRLRPPKRGPPLPA